MRRLPSAGDTIVVGAAHKPGMRAYQQDEC